MSAISTDGMDKWLDDAYPDLDKRKANMIYEISFDEFWEDYCKECEFDEEESDISTWNQEDLRDIAWDYILKDPEAYRSGDSDYDNEEIMTHILRMREV